MAPEAVMPSLKGDSSPVMSADWAPAGIANVVIPAVNRRDFK
jgi:hypothetical protein